MKTERIIQVTDGVHQVLINVINPEYVQQLESERKEAYELISDIETLFAKMNFNPEATNTIRLHSLMCIYLAKYKPEECGDGG